MIHTIENQDFTCAIESNGAEIRSFKRKSTAEEFIWQINPSVWGSSSPVLFPAIGNIKEGKIVYEGKSFAMPKHGMIRNNDSLLFHQINPSECSFTLKNSEETFKQYPFKFRFTILFKLVEQRLIQTYQIENSDNSTLYFACGGHTAYACPLDEKTKLSDYVVEFPNKTLLLTRKLGKSGLLSNQTQNILLIGNALALSENLFNEDALIFENVGFDWVRLRKQNEKKGILVRFKNYPNLALWSKPGADFLCIEPWLGLPDAENESVDITQKNTYQSLSPNEIFSIDIETEIEQ